MRTHKHIQESAETGLVADTPPRDTGPSADIPSIFRCSLEGDLRKAPGLLSLVDSYSGVHIG
jgi:hypothetical protein